jgi:type IV secretory pathway TrbF-like protein
MSVAENYRQYAAECWRSAWEQARHRDQRMAQASRWMALASIAAKTEPKCERMRGLSQWRGVPTHRSAYTAR